eukprot:scaffold121378_cov40-Prasinocladus_malaysianus.AAC.1
MPCRAQQFIQMSPSLPRKGMGAKARPPRHHDLYNHIETGNLSFNWINHTLRQLCSFLRLIMRLQLTEHFPAIKRAHMWHCSFSGWNVSQMHGSATVIKKAKKIFKPCKGSQGAARGQSMMDELI